MKLIALAPGLGELGCDEVLLLAGVYKRPGGPLLIEPAVHGTLGSHAFCFS